MRPPEKFVWRGNHHAYIGLALMGFGILQYYLGIPNYPANQALWFWQLLAVIGALMFADDVIEHLYTGNTPLRLLYEKVIVPWLMRNKK